MGITKTNIPFIHSVNDLLISLLKQFHSLNCHECIVYVVDLKYNKLSDIDKWGCFQKGLLFLKKARTPVAMFIWIILGELNCWHMI